MEEGLKRVVGVRTLAANAINMTVGAGIFALPAVIASYLGAASFLAYICCFALIICVLLCFVESGSKITTSGGAYAYIEAAFGPFVGFLSSTLFWFGYCIMADAAVANVLADSLATFWPWLLEPAPRALFLFLVFGALALLNVRGVKHGAALVEVVTLAKLIPLLILIVVGIFFIEPSNLHVAVWPSAKTLGEVSLILFFAFGGAEAALSGSGEINNPRRTIPRGILLGGFAVFIIYVLIQQVTQGLLGSGLASITGTPLATAADMVMGRAGELLMIIGAAISCFGLISGDMLTTTRLPYAAARDGLLPRVLARIHPRYATPYLAIVFYAGIGFILSVSGGFRQLAVMASAALLLVYVGVIASTIRLRTKRPDPEAFIIPGGYLVPVFGLVASAWFLSNLAVNELLTVAGFLAFFALIYAAMTFSKPTRNS